MPNGAQDDCRNKEIGQRIRVARLRLGWTQADTAARLGVVYQSMNKYEKGHNALTAVRLVDMAALLQVTVSWLVGESASETAALPACVGNLEGRMIAAFARIEDRALQLATVRTAEALGAVRKENKPATGALSSRHIGETEGTWTEVSAGWAPASARNAQHH